MTWLVTGGAGYIGAHIMRALAHAGMSAVAYDDLSTGRREFVVDQPLIEASILDTDALAAAMTDHGVTGVIHCAAFKYAGESVKRPVHTYRINVEGTGCVLDAMERAGARSLVFSSSAGVYGTPPTEVVTEETPTTPESPYGQSKLVAEWLVGAACSAAQLSGTTLAATSLRYFNVVGSAHPDIWDASPHNLLPRVFDGLHRGEPPTIFGADYPTPDGTCIRDYIHVADVAQSHVTAARRLDAGEALRPVYNLGSGTGTSVRQIMDMVVDVSGTTVTPIVGERRPGDPARIVASGDAAATDLDWAMRHTVRDMVASAWRAHPAAS